jgi:hypothetical protein
MTYGILIAILVLAMIATLIAVIVQTDRGAEASEQIAPAVTHADTTTETYPVVLETAQTPDEVTNPESDLSAAMPAVSTTVDQEPDIPFQAIPNAPVARPDWAPIPTSEEPYDTETVAIPLWQSFQEREVAPSPATRETEPETGER